MQSPAIKHVAKLGIARETTGRNCGRIYAHHKHLKTLNEVPELKTEEP